MVKIFLQSTSVRDDESLVTFLIRQGTQSASLSVRDSYDTMFSHSFFYAYI